MRNGKKPTRKQKIRLGQAGLSPENWLVVRQKPDGELILLHKLPGVELDDEVAVDLLHLSHAAVPSFLCGGHCPSAGTTRIVFVCLWRKWTRSR